MPQLNPAPWFYILAFSWFILLTVTLPKILNYIYPNEPALQNAEKTKQNSWPWPWY